MGTNNQKMESDEAKLEETQKKRAVDAEERFFSVAYFSPSQLEK